MEGIFRKNRILCIGMNVQGLLSFPSILMISATDLIQLLQIPVKTAYFCGVQRVQSISILYVLWQEDGIPIKAISEKCGLAITSLTTMLERMENQGLIRRIQSESDKRKTLLYLTKKAHTLKDEYDEVSEQMSKIYYKGFEEDEVRQFEAYLDRIRKNLEEWQES